MKFKKFRRYGNSLSLLGSMIEGSFSASFFKAVYSYVPTMDFDVAFKGNGSGINREHRHCIIESHKPGFVHLKFGTIDDKNYFRDVLFNYGATDEILDQIIGEGDYIRSNQLKELLRQTPAFNSHKLKRFASFSLNIPIRRIVVKQVRQVTKSSLDQTSEIYLDGELKLIIHVDFPILLQLAWSCPYVEVWKKRQRKWPDLDFLSEEMKISYLIAKTSREEKSNIKATEFQYSFAHIEQKIMTLLSTNQRTLFYTAKVIFKKTIQPFSEVYFPSFLIKNTMFLICEQTPPDHHLWDFISDEEFLISLRYFFKKLKSYFKDGFLPYYFIPDINLIDGLPEELSVKVLATLEGLLVAKDTHFLPDNENRDRVVSWMDSMERFLYEFEDILMIAQMNSAYELLEDFIDDQIRYY